MSAKETAHAKALQDLLDTLVDARHGIDSLSERATGHLVGAVQNFAKIHDGHFLALVEATKQSARVDPHSAGTLFAYVQKAVVALRDQISDLDGSALKAFLDGEEAIIGKYDSTIDALLPDHPLLPLLREQRADLVYEVLRLRREFNIAA